MWRHSTLPKQAVACLFLALATAVHAGRPPRLDSLATVLSRATTDSARVEALYTMGQVWRHANVDSGRACAEQALAIARRAAYRRGEAMALNLLGLLDFWQENHLGAVGLLDQALAMAEPLGDPQIIASILVNQGLVRKALGDLPGALALYQRQWSVSESAGDRLGQARAETNIGLLFREQGNEPEAMVHLRRSLALATELKDRQGMAITSSNVAVGLRKLGLLDSARQHYEQALALNTELGNERFRATNLMGLADVALEKGDRAVALEHLRNALRIRERTGNRSELAEVHLKLARTIEPKQGLPEAIAHAREALTIAEQARLGSVQAEACHTLGQLLLQRGATAEAAELFQRHIALRDSLSREEAVGMLARQQVAFDVARKERQMQELAQQEAKQREVAERRTQERDRVLLIALLLLLAVAVVAFLYLRIRRLNRALEVARSTAERNERAMDRFLSIMGHEVRSPMAAAIASLDMAAEGGRPKEERERYLGIAARSMRGLLRIVNDVLDRSAIEAGTLRIEHAPCVPLEILEQAARPFEALALGKGLTLSMELDAALGARRMGDAGRLAQVVTNLLGNALKYTDAGEVTLSARVEADDAIAIRISDTGRGMSEAQRRQLFTPFQRHDADGRSDPGGTGLGLYITAMLVQRMGGRIDVASEPGKGTTFDASVPMPKAEEAGAERNAKGVCTFFVADDDSEERNRLVALLKAIDPQCSVLQAKDGGEMLAKLSETHASDCEHVMLFTDLDMPGLTGFELVRAVKEGGHPRLPCVAVSSSLLMMDEEELRALGFQALLTKPVREESLRTLLRTISPAPGRGAALP